MSQSATQTEFKNENLTVLLKREPGSIVKLDISVSPNATKAAFEKAIKNVNKEVVLPGFRKGKAPRDFIVKTYLKHIENEQREIVVNVSFQEALELTKLHPYTKESIKVTQLKSISNEKGSDFTIQFETLPEVPKINPKDLHISKIAEEALTDDQIEKAVQELRLWHAEWVDVTDRPVKEDDYIDLDIDIMEDEERNLCKGTRFEVKKDKMGTWMRELVIGANPGDVVEGISKKEESAKDCDGCENPEHHHHDHDAFKETKCRITIKSIKEPKLPELDDAFAAKVGLKAITELNDRVREDMTRQAKEKAQTQMRDQVEDQLLEKYPFDLPASIVANEIQHGVENKIYTMVEEEGHSWEEVNARKHEIEEEVKEELEDSYKIFFLCNQLIRDNNLQATQDEVMREYVRQMYKPEGEALVNAKMDPKEIQSRLSSFVLSRKAKDFLVEHATIS